MPRTVTMKMCVNTPQGINCGGNLSMTFDKGVVGPTAMSISYPGG